MSDRRKVLNTKSAGRLLTHQNLLRTQLKSYPRTKFSDLVFTRQFTAFDSQNSESAESPFHGFFTLFWLGTAIFMIQTAAKNWQEHGNVLGTNDIMKIMIHHDLIVLGLSDGVMVAATSFGWLHQQLILKGYISWNKAGWVIQSVSSMLLESSTICKLLDFRANNFNCGRFGNCFS
jgi:hypothetical protein